MEGVKHSLKPEVPLLFYKMAKTIQLYLTLFLKKIILFEIIVNVRFFEKNFNNYKTINFRFTNNYQTYIIIQ